MNRVKATLIGGAAFAVAVAVLIGILSPDFRGPATWAIGTGFAATILLVYSVFARIALRWRGLYDAYVLSGLGVLSLAAALATIYLRPSWFEDACLAGTRCQSIVSGTTAFLIVLSLTFFVAAPLADREIKHRERRFIWFSCIVGGLAAIATFIAGLR